MRTRKTKAGENRYRVEFILAGRLSRVRYGGTFKTKREAERRIAWIRDELASMRIPDIRLLKPPAPKVTVSAAAEAWRQTRIDVAAGTADTHLVNIGRIKPKLGHFAVDELKAADVAAWVTYLHVDEKLKRESIRKTKSTLAMILDHAGVSPNPARDRSVKLPREDRAEVNPPEAAAVEAVFSILPKAYKLPLLVLDATGMRVGELEALTWGDVDEHHARWRVSAANAKTRRARWVPVPELVLQAVTQLVPREDRDLAGQAFAGFGADRFRTAITRACRAAGVPAFSPHDLRHRRATLWHLAGVPPVEAAAWLGHSPTEHLRTYAHATLSDRSELDYAAMLTADLDQELTELLSVS